MVFARGATYANVALQVPLNVQYSRYRTFNVRILFQSVRPQFCVPAVVDLTSYVRHVNCTIKENASRAYVAAGILKTRHHRHWHWTIFALYLALPHVYHQARRLVFSRPDSPR